MSEERTCVKEKGRIFQCSGYGGINQWRAWDEEKQDVIVARAVIFDEQPILDENVGITIV